MTKGSLVKWEKMHQNGIQPFRDLTIFRDSNVNDNNQGVTVFRDYSILFSNGLYCCSTVDVNTETEILISAYTMEL